MRRTILPLLLLLASVAQAEVRIVGAYPSDRTGARVAPRVGEPFYITVNLSLDGQTAPFRVTVDSPAKTLDTGELSYGPKGDYWVRQGEIVPLFDGPMDLTVACSAAKAPFNLRIVPASPMQALEAYRSQRLQSEYGASAAFARPASRLLAWLPIPQNSLAQTVESVDAAPRQAVTHEGQAIALSEAKASSAIGARGACATTARSVRSNLTALRAVPMNAVGKDKTWLRPEARVQSTHKEIVAFAKAATKGMDPKTPVADVALAVYSALLKRSVYAKTGLPPDALAALRNGKGECGDLSALFVAACRAVGVPARTVGGLTLGKDAWHVWAEFQVPGAGWVPVDPAYALGLRPRSAFPLYFGVVPEMRDRLALAVGFDASLGGEKSTFLQAPQIFVFDKAPLKSAASWGSVSSATEAQP